MLLGILVRDGRTIAGASPIHREGTDARRSRAGILLVTLADGIKLVLQGRDHCPTNADRPVYRDRARSSAMLAGVPRVRRRSRSGRPSRIFGRAPCEFQLADLDPSVILWVARG